MKKEHTPYRIQRALISVFDKTDIVPFAKSLHDAGIELLSTGGTAQTLSKAGIPVTEIAEYTKYPEMLEGRVKTLHPKVHGGLLYKRGVASHESTVAENNIPPIDLLVVNLYPFESTRAKKDATHEEIIEHIDIGGPAMLRSAAKNFDAVTVVVDPSDYKNVLQEIGITGSTTYETRIRLAGKVFATTATYDAAIARYFAETEARIPTELTVFSPQIQVLRYGENPHQSAGLYGKFNEYYQQLHGKELSYNNILDLTAATEIMLEFTDGAPTVVILKHMNPCGVGTGSTPVEAWRRAFATDTQAPFGGIIAVNVCVDESLALEIREIFSEVIIAPGFTDAALAVLTKKKNLRLMVLRKDPRDTTIRVRSVGAESYVAQTPDNKELHVEDVTVVSKRVPSEAEMRALLFAWKIAHHVKSNAIIFANEHQTLGIGAGQMSRIDSTRIAVTKANDVGLSLQGSALASDAFFPFPDGVIAAHAAGATAVIQPGGSLKDVEVIAAADERDMAMVFTHIRHFKH